MKQTFQNLKPHLSKVFGGLIVIAAIIVIVILSTGSPQKETTPVVPEVSPTSAGTVSSSDTDAPKSGFVVSTKPFIIPFTAKATVSTDAAGDKHGTFSVVFTIDPSDKNIIISPSCFSEEESTKRDGVAFSIIKDGTHVTGAGLSDASCVVLNRGSATKTKEGYYAIPAGTQNTFELIVANNPADAGAYRIQITNIGFRRSPTSITQFFELSPQTLQGLKTNSVEL